MFYSSGHLPVCTIFVFMALLSWTSPSVAQQRAPLTIAEAEDLALRGEPGRAALHARADALEEQAAAAGQLPDPTLRVGLANFPINSGGFSTEGMTQAQVGIRQGFPRTRAPVAKHFEAQSQVFVERADARARDVLTAVREDWLTAYYAQRAWSLITESRPFFADLVTVTRSMYSVGRKSQYDVLRAELELSRLDDRLIEMERGRAEAQASLSQWLGQDAYRPIAMKLPSWNALPVLEDLHANLLSHPKLTAAGADVTAKKAAIDVAEASKKPGWALDVGYGHRDGFLPGGEPRSDFVSVSVTVGLPFLGRSRQNSELAAALAERRAAKSSQAALAARLASDLEAEYVRWIEFTRRLALYEAQILDQSKNQVEAAMRAYQSDTGDFADLMRANIDDLNTRLEHIRLQVERARSYAALANLGGLEQ